MTSTNPVLATAHPVVAELHAGEVPAPAVALVPLPDPHHVELADALQGKRDRRAAHGRLVLVRVATGSSVVGL